MVSLDEFRAALGPDAPESEADLLALRDLLTGLAEGVLDSLSKVPESADRESTCSASTTAMRNRETD